MSKSFTVETLLHHEAALPADLAAKISPERRALWEVERQLWTPRAYISASGSVRGAVLTVGRPHTAYRKIVDVVVVDDSNPGDPVAALAVWATLVDAARDDVPDVDASHPVPLVVHFEEHLQIAPLSQRYRDQLEVLGFSPAPRPVPSIPSTRDGDSSEVAAWTWWRDERPTRLAPYYGQTTEVTCGAVASLMALELLGAKGFDPHSLTENRAAEITFWRKATNLPACEPIALAVEIAKSGGSLLSGLPRVILSTDEPVLLEEFASDEAETMLRTDLQRESLRQAQELGIPIERRWIEVEEIAEFVRAGAQVLLLIDLTELIADPTPHWVLASDVVGDNLIVSDPWVHYPNGETWVDTFALPIPLTGVDLVTRWGDPSYRGVVVLP
ncbi:hypothetical protein G7068_06165 [Leucobacter viscericola]|uniref:Peptidase_C39 like family protein n=1 Tax=Leucobacter viscericola TaxID=2714935 RepID=A0A6G7XEF2_9MICO|nr:peptidase C39 family protein [Leucobacter viscericola]QIK62829.1 hypothetical protein G7068_06165 [Leucobacter viscericola]